MNNEDEEIAYAIAVSIADAKDAEKKTAQSLRDEELARSLAREHDDPWDSHRDEDHDASYALALQLQMDSEKETAQPSANTKGIGNSSSGDSSSGGLGGGFMSVLSRFGGGEGRGSVQSALTSDKTCCICNNSNMFRSTLKAAGRTYCPDCFRCKGCRVRLEGRFFQNDATKASGAVYCESCVQSIFGLRCTLCANSLSGQYLRHGYFEDERYCMTHEQLEARRKCFTCSRLEPMPGVGRGQFVDLPDSRACCLECLSSAVMTTDEAVSLYAEAVDFMEAHLGLQAPAGMREVPVMAVDVHSLNEQASQGSTTHGGSVVDYRTGGVGATVRGLTLSRSCEVAHFGMGDLSFTFQHGFQINQPRVTRVETRREVTAVLVLYGLPRDLTSSILAHEAMHVWLKLQKSYPLNIDQSTEEGLCQVIARRFLKHLDTRSREDKRGGANLVGSKPAFKPFGNPIRTGGFDFHGMPVRPLSRNQLQTSQASPAAATSQPKETSAKEDPNAALEAKLRQYFVHSIENDPSPVYGGGYRAAERAVEEIGLGITLEHVRDNRRLPNL